MPETATLIAKVDSGRSRLPALCNLMSAGSLETTAPAISGADRRNEKRVAASRVKRRKRPAVIVMPERDTPGQRASAWAVPIVTASPMLDCSIGLFSGDLESAHHMTSAMAISEIA